MPRILQSVAVADGILTSERQSASGRFSRPTVATSANHKIVPHKVAYARHFSQVKEITLVKIKASFFLLIVKKKRIGTR